MTNKTATFLLISILLISLQLVTVSVFGQAPPPPPPPPPPPGIPIDGGVGLLIAAVVAYGATQIYKSGNEENS